MVCQSGIGEVGGGVAFIDRQPACVITTYSVVVMLLPLPLLQSFPGRMMGPISDAAVRVRACVRARDTHTC